MTNPRPNWNTAFRLGYEAFWPILAAVMENDMNKTKELEWESRALNATVENREARIAELEAELEAARGALRPMAECFENQEKTDELIRDFGYYAKQAARIYFRDDIERAAEQAARVLGGE